MTIRGEKQEEDAAELKLPEEFSGPEACALMISEVHMLLDHRRRENEQMEETDDLSETFVSTHNYTQRFSKFNSREMIRNVRGLFTNRNTQLHTFEVAQLANLCPESAEEAKALIPSLENKIGDEELDELLKSLANKKSFQ